MNKTKVFLLFTLMFYTSVSFSQSKVAVGFSPINSGTIIEKQQASRFTNKLIGSSSFSLQYLNTIATNLEFETGIDYSLFKIQSQLLSEPGNERLPITNNLTLIQVPIALRYNFNPYLYISGGVLLGFDTNTSAIINKQSGVGLIATLGVQYPFSNGIALFINPNFKLHSLAPFSSWKAHSRILDNGIKIGVSYSY